MRKKTENKDIINKKFNKIKIVSFAGYRNGKRFFNGICDCGNKIVTNFYDIREGKTKSCGCLKLSRITKHGFSRTKLYHVWISMKQRCVNKNSCNYHRYGYKGIKVCKEWYNDFMEFKKWSDRNGYKEGLTIDRIDNNGNYEPSNCRWTTHIIQSTNLSQLKTNKSGYKGVSWAKNIKEWICIISINNKSKRIGRYKTQKEAVKGRNDFINENNLPHQKNVYIGELSNGY